MQKASEFISGLDCESRKILSLIQKRGPLSKTELTLITNTKLSTLNRLMQPLEDQGFVVEVGIGMSTGGRKPVLYDTSPLKYYLVGIDISRTYTKVVITDMKLNILSQMEFAMDASCTPSATVANISRLLARELDKLCVYKSMVLGAGAGVVGPLDRTSGVIENAVHFPAPGWHNVPIGEMLKQAVGLPVVVDNGANMAVTAESLFGAGKGHDNIAYFHCGIGLRTAAIADGTLIRSINDSEDAFGHMVVDIDGRRCSCGNFGCIECYCSINAITLQFVSELKKGRKSCVDRTVEDINYKDVCEAAQKGDELAVEVIRNAALVFAAGLANFINLFNPGVVILSGPLISRSELFYSICTEAALTKCYAKEKNSVRFSRMGFFKDNAIAAGAAAMAFEQLVGSSIK